VWGDTDPAQIAGNFFARAPPLFASKSTIGRFGECFRDGQYSLVSFLFAVLLLTLPPMLVGWRVSPSLIESAPVPTTVADPKILKGAGGGRQCIRPVVTYRKNTQPTMPFTKGKAAF